MADAEQTLRELLNQIAKEQDYEHYEIIIKPISTSGANYTSELFLATITEPDKKDLNVFAKVAALGEKLRQQSPITRLYNIERLFYQKLAKKYNDMQEKHEVPERERLVFPKFYGCNAELLKETMVLENLMAQEFTMYDRFKSVDWEYAAASITEMAKLHALSIAYGEDNPDDYKEILKDLKFNMFGDMEQMEIFWKSIVGTALAAVKEENRERVKKFIETSGTVHNYLKFMDPKRRPVVIHGDFRPSNLLHKKHQDGRLQVIIVDYQTMQTGCPVQDLFYFIFTGTDEEFRARYYDKLIEHYYSQLCQALRTLHVDPEKVYSREDFDYELKEMLPYGLFVATFTLQIVTVEAANAPKFDECSDFSEFAITTSELFAERMNGIVNDYIRWGVI